MIKFDQLYVTQKNVRNIDQIHGMTTFALSGGLFGESELLAYAKLHSIDKRSPLVQINQFEDGKYFLLDGHHRGLSLFAAGREFFVDDEYEIKHYRYSDFTDIVFKNTDGSWLGWVTPFDPRCRLRLPQLKSYKDAVKYIYDNDGELAAVRFIEDHQNDYSILKKDLKRPMETLVDMFDYYKEQHLAN